MDLILREAIAFSIALTFIFSAIKLTIRLRGGFEKERDRKIDLGVAAYLHAKGSATRHEIACDSAGPTFPETDTSLIRLCASGLVEREDHKGKEPTFALMESAECILAD